MPQVTSRREAFTTAVPATEHVMGAAYEQVAVNFDDEMNVFLLQTPSSTYAFQIRDGRWLLHLHWGGRVARAADCPAGEQLQAHGHEEDVRKERHREEYAGWGGYFYDEPGVKVTHADGTRDLDLAYAGHVVSEEVGGLLLTVTMRDRVKPVEVDLCYRLRVGTDVIERWAALRNDGPYSLQVESLQAATWYPMEGRGHRLTHLAGRWAAEHRIQRVPLTQSKVVLESRHGVSGPAHNPWFAVDEQAAATETHGRVWFGAFAWSGNWKITVEQDRWDQVRVTGGYNDFDFSLALEAGGTHRSPSFYGGYTNEGFGGASRLLHDLQRDHLLPEERRSAPRPVIFNSWEAFWFDINIEQQLHLADSAAALGAEVFVVDDGWFGSRDDDTSALGDWTPSPRKFPEGLRPLSEHVQRLGMKFGLWVEPEMVSPDSDLYRAHPDWVIQFPGRAGTQVRNQLVLNLADDRIRDWTLQWLTQLVHENDISYLKWDMNRYLTEPGAGEVPMGRSLWVSYVENLYWILGRLRSEHPDLIIENCCSGGGRADLGMTPYSDLVARSDNSDGLDMLALHEGFTQVFPAIVTGGGIGGVPNGINGRTTPLVFRAHAGMLGAFHIGVDLLSMPEADLATLRECVALYKEIRHLVHLGDLYRLVSPTTNPYAAFQYLAKDGDDAVVLVFGANLQFQHLIPRLRLQGLDPEKVYAVQDYKQMSGAALMHIGIPLYLGGDYDSRLIRISAVPADADWTAATDQQP